MLLIRARGGLGTVLAAAVTTALCGGAVAQAQTATTTLEARTQAGTGAYVTDRSAVSADGRYVAFPSFSANVVPGDTNDATDFFLRDRATGQTRRINVGPNGEQPGGATGATDISDDGRYVAFANIAAGLVPDGGSIYEVFVFDRVTGGLRRIRPPAGTQATGTVAISGDGGRVAFGASPTDQNSFEPQQVYVGDVASGAVSRVSQTAGGTAGNDYSISPAISADGRWVAFATNANNLVTDKNGQVDIVVRELLTGTLTRVSVGVGGFEANGPSASPALSADGCAVAFTSSATNLVTGDAGQTPKVFVRDRCLGSTEIASLTNAAQNNQRTASGPDISADGCLVAFISSTVFAAPPSGAAAVLRDRCQGATSRLDLSTAGEPGGQVFAVRLSGGTARYAAFLSQTPTLVAGESGEYPRLYLRDRADRNAPPIAELALTRDGARVTADARGSRDPDGHVVSGSVAFGDGSPAQNGVIAVHDYERPGTYGVTVTIKDADGATATRTAVVTVPDAAAQGTQSPPPPAIGAFFPPPTAPGRTPGTTAGGRSLLESATLSRRRFAVAPRTGRPRAGQGATLTVRLRDAASVRVVFERAVRGRRSGGRCSPRAKRGSRCTAYARAGTITRDLEAGTSKIALTGRIGSRTLAAGTYRLRVSADGGAERTLSFAIAPKRRRSR